MKDTIWQQLALWGPPQKPDNWSWNELNRRLGRQVKSRKPRKTKATINPRLASISLDSLLS